MKLLSTLVAAVALTACAQELPKLPSRVNAPSVYMLDSPSGPMVWSHELVDYAVMVIRLGDYNPVKGGHTVMGTGAFDTVQAYGFGFIVGQYDKCGSGVRIIPEAFLGVDNKVFSEACSEPMNPKETYKITLEGGKITARDTGNVVFFTYKGEATSLGQLFVIPIPGGTGRPAYFSVTGGRR